MKMKLMINDISIDLGIESIKDFILFLSDKSDYQEFYHEMALSNVSSIRQSIAIKTELSETTAKLLLTDKDIDVLESIIENNVAHSIITDDDIEYIIIHASQSTIKYLASNIKKFKNIDISKTYKKLLKLDNPDILLSIARCSDTPSSILEILMKHPDIDITEEAKNKYSLAHDGLLPCEVISINYTL